MGFASTYLPYAVAGALALAFLVFGNYIGAAVLVGYMAILAGLNRGLIPASWVGTSRTGNVTAIILVVVIALSIAALWWVITHGA
jgi:hypothetical protein